MPTARVNINPEVLLWAVDYSQKGIEAFENKFKQFHKWLNKSEQPTVKQLEDVAKFSYVPFGYLLLPFKPNIKINPIQDFRTINNHDFIGTDKYSANLRDTIMDIRMRQEWLHEYKIEQGYNSVTFVGSISHNMTDNDIVKKIRQELHLPINWQEHIGSKTAAFRYFLDVVESKGIMVFVNGIVGNNIYRKLSVKEFRGFALVDDFAPVIFINGADAPAARLFTLLHEVVHIFLGRDGLDDHSEPFCNRIAAKILVPYDSFNEQWNLHANDYDTLENFFKVSQLVLYRMALVYGKIDDKEYKRLVTIYDKKYQEKKNNESNSGGNFYNTSPYRAGRSFCKYLREALTEGKISYGEAYQLLGVRGNTFENVMKSAVQGRE